MSAHMRTASTQRHRIPGSEVAGRTFKAVSSMRCTHRSSVGTVRFFHAVIEECEVNSFWTDSAILNGFHPKECVRAIEHDMSKSSLPIIVGTSEA